jgi:hypothetical protein
LAILVAQRQILKKGKQGYRKIAEKKAGKTGFIAPFILMLFLLWQQL